MSIPSGISHDRVGWRGQEDHLSRVNGRQEKRNPSWTILSEPLVWSRATANAFRKMDGWLTGPFGIRNDPDDRVAEAQPKTERV
jgi:hypothetical protein